MQFQRNERYTMFQEGVLLTFVLFYISSNCKCESTIDIPLITKLDAPLKAELDITALTKQLKSLISEEIKRYVGNAEDDYTGLYRQGLQSDIFNVTEEVEQYMSKAVEDIKEETRNQLKILDTLMSNLLLDNLVTVDGQWSEWTSGPCSVSCGVGMEIRTRQCSNPYPSNGGKYCVGQAVEQIKCIQQSCSATDHHNSVSFYVYMSGNKINIKRYEKLIYDAAITNDGNGYDVQTGVFTVPQTGQYVFTWSTTVWVRSAYETQLMINGDVKGFSFADAGEATDADTSTGVIVVKAQKGDRVYVRTGTYVRNRMQSGEYGRTSFTGWKIY